MSKKVLILAVFLILILATGAGVWQWQNQKKMEAEKQNALLQQKQAEEARKKEEEKQHNQNNIDTSDWKIYRDEKYKFEIKYNPGWEIVVSRPSAVGGDALTIIIDKDRRDTGMNIVSFKSDMNVKSWHDKYGSDFGGEKFKEVRSINNYDAYYVREDNSKVYLNLSYLISNNGRILLFSFMEKYRKLNRSTGQYEETSFSQYLPDFEAMVYSIRFFD